MRHVSKNKVDFLRIPKLTICAAKDMLYYFVSVMSFLIINSLFRLTSVQSGVEYDIRVFRKDRHVYCDAFEASDFSWYFVWVLNFKFARKNHIETQLNQPIRQLGEGTFVRNKPMRWAQIHAHNCE